MRNVSDKSCRENQNTHFVFNNFPPPPENRAVYEIIWKNVVQCNGPQVAIRPMCIARLVSKATETHSEYVTIIAVPLQQQLRERASMLRHTYTACLVHSQRTIERFNGRRLERRGLPWAVFHEIHKRSTALHADVLCRIGPSRSRLVLMMGVICLSPFSNIRLLLTRCPFIHGGCHENKTWFSR